MSRDTEKILMKELEQAIEVEDKARAKHEEAVRSSDAAATILRGAIAESEALANAIMALRKGPITETHRRNIVNDARNAVKSAKKEKPVA